MSKEYVARRLDIRAFAQAGGQLRETQPLSAFTRLAKEAAGEVAGIEVNSQAHGELRHVTGGADQVWLRLRAETRVPMVCQRCLTPVDVALSFDRAFRFVADEATAAALDEDSDEEDVLVLSPAFDLTELVEDELLMALPLVPRHEVCPVDVKLAATDKDFDDTGTQAAHPFAALARLKG